MVNESQQQPVVIAAKRATVAYIPLKLSDGTVLEGYGEAVRHRDDKDDPAIGHELALSRAFADLSRQLHRRAWGKVKHADNLRRSKERKKSSKQKHPFTRLVEDAAKLRAERALRGR
jgi:hypothetical protein